MKYITRLLILSLGMLNHAAFAKIGPLFNVAAVGASGNVNLTLCLNGTGPLTCQIFNVSNLEVIIRTVVQNHTYPAAGIKINTPGYAVIQPGIACTPINNGYCLFSVSDRSPHTIAIRKIT